VTVTSRSGIGEPYSAAVSPTARGSGSKSSCPSEKIHCVDAADEDPDATERALSSLAFIATNLVPLLAVPVQNIECGDRISRRVDVQGVVDRAVRQQ
jgi:hypothetical protein